MWQGDADFFECFSAGDQECPVRAKALLSRGWKELTGDRDVWKGFVKIEFKPIFTPHIIPRFEVSAVHICSIDILERA